MTAGWTTKSSRGRESYRDLSRGWRDDYAPPSDRPVATEGPVFMLIDDDHQPKPMTEAELTRRGLGHIVMTGTPDKQRRHETAPTTLVPDTSIFLG